MLEKRRMNYFQRKPTTPEEIKDSRDARTVLKAGIASAKEQLKSAIAINIPAGFTSADFKPVEDIIKKADEWVFANPRPFAQDSADQLEALLANLTSAYEDIKDRGPLPKKEDDPKEIERKKKIEEKKEKAKQEIEQAKKKVPKKFSEQSSYEVIMSALTTMLWIVLAAVVVGILIRSASYISNQYLIYPPSFRIIYFVYSLLLPIYSIPVSFYEWVKRLPFFKRNDSPVPPLIMESMIPLYEVNEPVENILDQTFHWFRSPFLNTILSKESTGLEEARKKVLEPV